MDKTLTIQDFSEKTGIPKSALRYYETKNLLHPIERKENGYRIYGKDQIAMAKLISSLRIADIPIKDIQAYVNKANDTQNEIIKRWRKKLQQRKKIIEISLQYLEGGGYEREIYLLEKESERVIWFDAEEQPGNFGYHFKMFRKILKHWNIPVSNSYLRYISGIQSITCQVGFGIPQKINTDQVLQAHVIEQMKPILCIALPFNKRFTDIESGYHYLVQYAKDNQWIPAGPIFEWYRGDQYEEMDIMMPVLKIGGEK